MSEPHGTRVKQEERERSGVRAMLLKLAETLVTPLTVALVGIIGSQYLAERERAETDVRFYTELMSRREESDSGLRKEMFNSILTNFLKPVDERSLEESVLNLELLAYNFHDSLDLAPLFKEVYDQIFKGKIRKAEKGRLLDRLDSVTQQVKEKQVSMLSEAGAKLEGSINFRSLEEMLVKANGHEVSEVTNGGEDVFDSTRQTLKEYRAKLELLQIDRVRREVKIRLKVLAPSVIDAGEFKVGYFDFPMLNNVRLPENMRCAVVLRDFQNDSADFVVAFFPASRASLKDKPYYDELTGYLQNKRNRPRDNGGP